MKTCSNCRCWLKRWACEEREPSHPPTYVLIPTQPHAQRRGSSAAGGQGVSTPPRLSLVPMCGRGPKNHA